MQELCFGGGQGHVRVPSPFFVFFNGVSDEQRGGADERAQRVADHVIYLRHAEGITVLRILDSRAEHAADERCEDDSKPAVPLSRQGVGQCQPQREEEKHIHQHLAVELRLLPRSGESGEGGENDLVIAGRAGQDGCKKDKCQRAYEKRKVNYAPPIGLCSHREKGP